MPKNKTETTYSRRRQQSKRPSCRSAPSPSLHTHNKTNENNVVSETLKRKHTTTTAHIKQCKPVISTSMPNTVSCNEKQRSSAVHAPWTCVCVYACVLVCARVSLSLCAYVCI